MRVLSHANSLCILKRALHTLKQPNVHSKESYIYMYLYIYIYTYTRYRVAKTHRIPYLYRSFSAKVTYIWWLFCGN